MSSHTLMAVGVVVVGIIVAAFGASKSRRSWQERQAVSAASAASADSLRAGQGPVELRGTAHTAEHSFTSPLTQQECVAYRLEKREKQRVYNDDDALEVGEEGDDHHHEQPDYERRRLLGQSCADVRRLRRGQEIGAPGLLDRHRGVRVVLGRRHRRHSRGCGVVPGSGLIRIAVSPYRSDRTTSCGRPGTKLQQSV